MAAADTWMPLYVGDYVKDTMHLSTRQHGGYLLLILAAWNAAGVLPGNDAGLMSIARLQPKEWKEDGPVLKAFLTRQGDEWIHIRVMREWQKAQAITQAKINSGKTGAEIRWGGRRKAKAMAEPSRSHKHTDDTAIAEPSICQWQTDAPSPSPRIGNPPLGGSPYSHETSPPIAEGALPQAARPAIEPIPIAARRMP